MKVDIFTTTEGLELLGSALADLGHHSYAIKDAADFEEFLEGKHGRWDYIRHDLLELHFAETTITVYLPNEPKGQEELQKIRETLKGLKDSDVAGKYGRLECDVSNIKDEDWGNAWKRCHEPIAVGKKLIICPPWEGRCPEGRVMLRIDPGMAFGNGADETTRLCLEALEKTVENGCTVLDVGCGSGILSIGALLLGAGSALGTDVDQAAVDSAKKNAALNGLSENAAFICSELVDKVTETYDIVCANISADVIIALAPEAARVLKPGGTLILSGIIENREKDVLNAISESGISPSGKTEENGWVCIVGSQED